LQLTLLRYCTEHDRTHWPLKIEHTSAGQSLTPDVVQFGTSMHEPPTHAQRCPLPRHAALVVYSALHLVWQAVPVHWHSGWSVTHSACVV